MRRGAPTRWGVARQYTGAVGKVTNCVNAGYCSYASDAGHALCDVRLYLHRSWADDPARRARAGVPDRIRFATKPALAGGELISARGEGIDGCL